MNTKYFGIKKKGQKGFTMLEYCAGAAVLLGIVIAGMGVFGDGVTGYFTNLGTWVQGQALPSNATGNRGN